MTPDSVQGSRATVVGGARSGLAVARLLTRAGASVFVTDTNPANERAEAALDDIGVSYEFGGHTDRALEAEYFVVSPGVPTQTPIVQRAIENDLAIYSEIEAASWFCKAPVIAVTGSNGKTTTTRLIADVIDAAGRTAIVAGNIGYPFSDYVLDTTPDDLVVAEVSSFQLDHISTFRPWVSMLLNITPDHLDRYEHDFDAYAASKCRIFENQGEGETLIYNEDDETLRRRLPGSAEERGVSIYTFSQENEVRNGAFLRNDTLVLRINNNEEVLMERDELSLRGRHNLYNSMAAAVAGQVINIQSEQIRNSLARFEGVRHRLEFVREVDGVQYVNDSKATNVNAVWYALESFEKPIVLIAGGRDKGNDYSMLHDLVREKVRTVVALGESADYVESDLGSRAQSAVKTTSMEDAIRQARASARPGDVVLLSPACSSLDMFENYEERGDTFRKLVHDMT